MRQLELNDSMLMILHCWKIIRIVIKLSSLNYWAQLALLHSDFFNKKWLLLFNAKIKFPDGISLRPGWIGPLMSTLRKYGVKNMSTYSFNVLLSKLVCSNLKRVKTVFHLSFSARKIQSSIHERISTFKSAWQKKSNSRSYAGLQWNATRGWGSRNEAPTSSSN